jgi:hypothetical protein
MSQGTMPRELVTALQQTRKAMPLIDDVFLQQLGIFHHKRVRTVVFDKMHESWQWDRTFPRGLLQIENNPLQPPMNHSRSNAEDPRLLVLQYLEGTRALLQLRTNGGLVGGEGSGTCGHTEVLIPAPQMLLKSPAHPLYTMEGTTWIPFRTVANVDYFLTPYHRGIFNTSFDSTYCVPGAPAIVGEKRPALFPLNSSDPAAPFSDAVYYSTVVSWLDGEGQECQGVTLLTYVRMRPHIGKEYVVDMLKEGPYKDVGGVLPPIVSAALDPLPETGPVPMLAVWPLHACAAQQKNECHQSFRQADVGGGLLHIRAHSITRVWGHNELGALGKCTEKQLQKIAHRTLPESAPLRLRDPAAPTQLRQKLQSPFITQAVLKWVSEAVPAPANGASADGGAFLRHIREQGAAGFDIDGLLTVRAVVNSAQPLAAPGLLEMHKVFDIKALLDKADAEQQSAAASSASASAPPPKRPTSRAAAVLAAKKLDKLAVEDASEKRADEAGAAFTTPKRGRARTREFPTSNASTPTPPSTVRSASRTSRQASMSPVWNALDDQPEEQGEEEEEPQEDGEEAATPSEASSSEIRDAGNLFYQLANVFEDERVAPFAGAVWDNWYKSDGFCATLPKPELHKPITAWKQTLWESLPSLDAQLHAFIIEAGRQGHTVQEVSQALAKRHGAKNKHTFRQDPLLKHLGGPDKEVQLLWSYNDGDRPEASDSIWDMHCKNVWYGVKHGSPHKIDSRKKYQGALDDSHVAANVPKARVRAGAAAETSSSKLSPAAAGPSKPSSRKASSMTASPHTSAASVQQPAPSKTRPAVKPADEAPSSRKRRSAPDDGETVLRVDEDKLTESLPPPPLAKIIVEKKPKKAKSAAGAAATMSEDSVAKVTVDFAVPQLPSASLSTAHAPKRQRTVQVQPPSQPAAAPSMTAQTVSAAVPVTAAPTESSMQQRMQNTMISADVVANLLSQVQNGAAKLAETFAQEMRMASAASETRQAENFREILRMQHAQSAAALAASSMDPFSAVRK